MHTLSHSGLLSQSCPLRRPPPFSATACRPLSFRVAAVRHIENAEGTVQQQAAAPRASALLLSTAGLYLLSEAAAHADSPFAGVQSNSLYVTGALFLMCVPGE